MKRNSRYKLTIIRCKKISLKFIKMSRVSSPEYQVKVMSVPILSVISPSSLSIFDMCIGKIFVERRLERSIALDSIERCFRLASPGGKNQGAVRPSGAAADEGDERQYTWPGYRQSPDGAALRGEGSRRADPGDLHGRGLRDR